MDHLPDTPVGQQAAWFFHHSKSYGRDLTVEDVTKHIFFDDRWTPENSIENFREGPGEVRILSVEEASPYELVVHLVFVSETEKPWLYTFRVEENPPHLITWLQSTRDVGAGVVIREAKESDGPALADLERRSPLRVGDVSITYDRGDDFFAFARLMEETVNLVAEENGQILGLNCGALHSAVVKGKTYQAMLIHHSRVPVEHRKKGLFSPLNSKVFEAYAGRMEAAYAYVAVDNTVANRLGGPGSWSFPAMRGLLPCDSLAGSRVGRSARQQDAARIVEILNACHDGEEMYVPYTVESFAARVERAPELYSWDQIWLTDRSVLGVWSAGLRVVREEAGRREESVRATVLDYGFLPGADAEFEELIRSWCGRLLDGGTTELAIMTSEGSPNYRIVSQLAARMEAYDFRMEAPEPEGAAQRGLYIDAVYF